MVSHRWKLAIILFICNQLWMCVLSTAVQCKDENNNPVDWFVAIKLPRLKKSKDINVREGVAYIFITSESSKKENWTFSSRSVRDLDSVMGNTLQPIYSSETSEYARILYNDEPPHGNTTATLGHTKGVAVGNAESGFWLVHSVPHYPPEAGLSAYSYPNSGAIYGQSFLCISVDQNGLEIIGQQLMYNEPYIYDASVPQALINKMPFFTSAAKGERIHSSPWFKSASFPSAGGETFISFAKSKNFGKDLYADWVAQDLQADLFVETWNHGPGEKMKSECEKPFKVENVEGISFGPFSFKTGEDHSKWAVSSEISKPWICVGDINRMEHQRARGGGTVCLQNSALYHAYHDSVTTLDVCPAVDFIATVAS